VGGTLTASEDAIHLLRRVGLPALALHWVGSAPFALALLRFWNGTTTPRAAASTVLVDSLVLALLLLWMNCWRSVFAGVLRRRLADSPVEPWTAGRVWRLAAAQAILGGVKLLVMPLAALILFPLAQAAAFYRFACVLAGAGNRHPFDAIAKARRLAGLRTNDEWLIVPLLLFLWLLVFLNVATALFLLPQLAHMLTGYESQFSRSGLHLIDNALFWLLSAALAWLAFDPFVQSVYCVLCFRAESAETGEDVRAGLRRVRAGGKIAAAMLLLAIAVPSRAQVSKPELRDSIEQAMQAHEFDWRLPPEIREPAAPSRFVAFTDRVLEGVRAALRSLGRIVRRFFEWLADRFRVNMPRGTPGMPGSAAMESGMWLVIAVAALGLGLLLWRAPWAKLRRRTHFAAAPIAGIRLDSDAITASDLPEERWIELALACEREGNPRLALRALYLANLAWLGRLEFIAIHPGKTNREYEAELRRRTRALPDARRLFAANVTAFERAWYGMHDIPADALAEFRGRFGAMKPILTPLGGVMA
jgi:hypothetical protein